MSNATIVVLTHDVGFKHEMLADLRMLDAVVRVDGLDRQADGSYRRFDVYLATPEAAALFLKIAADNFPDAKMTEIT